MLKFVIPLEHMILDPTKSLNLPAMPEKDALDRLGDKPRSEIIKVVSEISTLGMSGIDHRNVEKTYQLNAYPEEKFSGLHLLCLMYVGFQLYDSSIDCGLDFADAYQLACKGQSRSVH